MQAKLPLAPSEAQTGRTGPCYRGGKDKKSASGPGHGQRARMGSMVGFKKYGRVVPMLGYTRLRRGFAKTTGSVSLSSWMGHVPVSL